MCINRNFHLIQIAEECTDNDNGHTNVNGDGCNVYNPTGDFCGDYDDDDFDSRAMCCICGGGQRGNKEGDLDLGASFANKIKGKGDWEGERALKSSEFWILARIEN